MSSDVSAVICLVSVVSISFHRPEKPINRISLTDCHQINRAQTHRATSLSWCVHVCVSDWNQRVVVAHVGSVCNYTRRQTHTEYLPLRWIKAQAMSRPEWVSLQSVNVWVFGTFCAALSIYFKYVCVYVRVWVCVCVSARTYQLPTDRRRCGHSSPHQASQSARRKRDHMGAKEISLNGDGVNVCLSVCGWQCVWAWVCVWWENLS